MSTSADRKEEKNMSEMVITVSQATTAPNYEITAAGLLEAARRFYQDPENEAAFMEWKAGKEKKHERHEKAV